jgi:hypothetical protein
LCIIWCGAGAQIYNGGYGASYVQGIAMMLSWTRGTPLGLLDSDPRVAIYSSVALDGTRRMMTYGVPPAGSPWGVALYDVSVIGRDVARPYASNWGMQAGPQVTGSGVMPQGYGLTPVLMAGVGGPRAAEFAAFAALLNGSATPAQGAAALLGNRVFWTADYAVHASAAGDWAGSAESGGAAADEAAAARRLAQAQAARPRSEHQRRNWDWGRGGVGGEGGGRTLGRDTLKAQRRVDCSDCDARSSYEF